MKHLPYIIAGLLVITWTIIYFGFNSGDAGDILLAVAGIIVLMKLSFRKGLA